MVNKVKYANYQRKMNQADHTLVRGTQYKAVQTWLTLEKIIVNKTLEVIQ